MWHRWGAFVSWVRTVSNKTLLLFPRLSHAFGVCWDVEWVQRIYSHLEQDSEFTLNIKAAGNWGRRDWRRNYCSGFGLLLDTSNCNAAYILMGRQPVQFLGETKSVLSEDCNAVGCSNYLVTYIMSSCDSASILISWSWWQFSEQARILDLKNVSGTHTIT